VGSSPPELPAPTVNGAFAGWIEVEGSEIEGILRLSSENRVVTGSFSSNELGIEARGQGRFQGERLELTLTYEMDCPGELRFLGTLSGDGRWYRGSLVAADCTGTVRGQFSFERVASR
jgi:hypothetical protein